MILKENRERVALLDDNSGERRSRRWSFRRRSGQNENETIAGIDEDGVWVRNDER